MFFGPTKGVTKLLARSLDAITKRLQARPVGDTPIVAWHEVPGKASSKEPFRRYGMIGRKTFSIDSCIRAYTPYTRKNHTVPYGTDLLGWHLSQALRARLRSHCPSGTKNH